ncbi:unnamed protein product [Ascophyllum nodosum]
MSKRLGGIKGCKYKTSSWHLNRFPDADNIGSTVQCRGEVMSITSWKGPFNLFSSRKYQAVTPAHAHTSGCVLEKPAQERRSTVHSTHRTELFASSGESAEPKTAVSNRRSEWVAQERWITVHHTHSTNNQRQQNMQNRKLWQATVRS